MTPQELKARTKVFALGVIRVASELPRDPASKIIANQLIRSATSVGANYRAACKAQSRAAFAAKLAIVEEEADETVYWLELLVGSGRVKPGQLDGLVREAQQLTAIVAASRKTVLRRSRQVDQPIGNRQSTIGNRRDKNRQPYET